MSIIISAYSRAAFQEFLLPSADNIDTSVIFYSDVFDLTKDESIHLENIGGKWYYSDSEDYTVFLGQKPYDHQEIRKNDIAEIRFASGALVSLIIRETERALRPFRLFDMRGSGEIVFGNSRDADVRVRMLGLISHRHLALRFSDGKCMAEDLSRNGIFINRRKAGHFTGLETGDQISLFGVKVIWLGTVLAVESSEERASVQSPVLAARELSSGDFSSGGPRKIFEPVLHKSGWHTLENIHRRAPRMSISYPSAEECAKYDNSTAALWNRNTHQKDFLFERLGTVPGDRSKTIGVDLRANPIIGVLSRKNRAEALGIVRNLLVQIAANNSPADVKIAVIYNRGNGIERNMLGDVVNLPHVWADDRSLRFVADKKSDADDVFYELAKRIRKRTETQADEQEGTRYVVVITDRSLLEGRPIAKYILSPKKEYGLSLLFPADRDEELPNECELFIENDDRYHGIYSVTGAGVAQEVAFDELSEKDFTDFAKRIADIRVKETKEHAIVPEHASFLDLYGASSAAELDIEGRWLKNRTYESLAARIGLRGTARPVFLDINERFHGPHGLVAGMTGSGKSEFLSTYLLSMAVEFSPEDVNFLLIDYKGGGMANLLKGLPHIAGEITNLSGNGTRRALLAVRSEIIRRQKVFAANGVNHIHRYTKLYKNHLVKDPMPHLLIVVDEFAELKKEQPEFLDELISVAQIGRSLGIHLILSTQRPAGCVDDQIRSNSRFRICLRVQNRRDSEDMLGHPDAAFLTETGRAYLEVGQDEIYQEFQTGWGGDPDGSGESEKSVPARMITITGRPFLLEEQGRVTGKNAAFGSGRTQMETVTDRIRETAEKGNYEIARTLWLPMLPDRLNSDDLTQGCAEPLHAVVGLADDPAKQLQFPAEVDFVRDGHLAVLGATASGKSTLLATMALSLLKGTPADLLNLYILDFGGGMLEAFKEAPAVGGYMSADTPDKMRHFFKMLDRVIPERRQKLKGGNYEQYLKRCGNSDGKERMPAVVVMIDQYAAFREQTENAYFDTIVRLFREGMSCGIYLVLSASGYGNNGIERRLAEYIRNVICLEMKDPYAYAEAFHVLRLPVLPEEGISGRGLIRTGRKILEFQTACPVLGAGVYEQMDEIRKVCGRLSDVQGNEMRNAVPEIPEHPLLEDFLNSGPAKELMAEGNIPLGWREEDASVFSIDLNGTFSFLLEGPYGSGNTECLANMMKTVHRTYVVSGERQFTGLFIGDDHGLQKTAEKCGFVCAENPEEVRNALQKLIPLFTDRVRIRREMLREGAGGNVSERAEDHREVILAVEDLGRFFDTISDPEKQFTDLWKFLENMTENGRDLGIHFISALNPFDSVPTGLRVFENLIRERKGLYFGAGADAQRILHFQNIPYAVRNSELPEGTALISDGIGDITGGIVRIPGERERT